MSGTVLGRAPIEGARVHFVSARAVVDSDSLQPVEDLAPRSPGAWTDAGGRYSLSLPKGRYFPYVTPPSALHEPGGDLSDISVEVRAGAALVLDLRLSEAVPPGAEPIGSGNCLPCHGGAEGEIAAKSGLSAHSRAVRRPGIAGVLWDDTSLRRLPRSFPGGVATDGEENGRNDFEEGKTLTLHSTGGASRYTTSVTLGFRDRDGSGTLTEGDVLTATLPIGEPPRPVRFDISHVRGGGKAGRLWGKDNGQIRFLTLLDDQGNPVAPEVPGPRASHFLLPFVYRENAMVGQSPRWAAAPELVTQWVDHSRPPTTLQVPAPAQSYDLLCAGCHVTPRAVEGNRFLLPEDPAGKDDWDRDGRPDHPGVGCEECHGPGSEHRARAGAGAIVHPGRLGPAARDLVCGRCHSAGEAKGRVQGMAVAAPSRGEDGTLEFPRPGILPAAFFGTARGQLPDFGSRAPGGFLDPVSLASDADTTWADREHGSRRNSALRTGIQYLEFARTRMARNATRRVTCSTCHDPHGGKISRELRRRADNNVLCLGCHHERGCLPQTFPGIKLETVEAIEAGRATEVEIHDLGEIVMNHVAAVTFRAVGSSMNFQDLYFPENDIFPLGRCTICHMPRTAIRNQMSREYDGFPYEGDVRSHSFEGVSPMTSRRQALRAPPRPHAPPEAVVPNACVPCHRLERIGFPHFRYWR